jgi:hypothetical protein
MKVAFLGAGTVTAMFGRHLIIAGHTVVVSNSRGLATLDDFGADHGLARGPGSMQPSATSSFSPNIGCMCLKH